MQIIPNIKGGEWQTVHFLKIANWKKNWTHWKMQNGYQEQLKENLWWLWILEETSLTNWWKQIMWMAVCSPSTLSLLLVGGPDFALWGLPPCPTLYPSSRAGIQRPPPAYQHLPSLGRNDGCRACRQTWAPPRLLGRVTAWTGVATQLSYKSGVRGDHLTRRQPESGSWHKRDLILSSPEPEVTPALFKEWTCKSLHTSSAKAGWTCLSSSIWDQRNSNTMNTFLSGELPCVKRNLGQHWKPSDLSILSMMANFIDFSFL